MVRRLLVAHFGRVVGHPEVMLNPYGRQVPIGEDHSRAGACR